jgi:hypothetical protein
MRDKSKNQAFTQNLGLTLINRIGESYKTGLEIILASNGNKSIIEGLSAYLSENSRNVSFSLIAVDDPYILDIDFQIGSGSHFVLVAYKKLVIRIDGNEGTINKLFKKIPGSDVKSDTKLLTDVKERVSEFVLSSYQNGRIVPNISDVKAHLKKSTINFFLFKDMFYDSAIKQLDAYRKIRIIDSKSQYDFHLQEKGLSSILYKKARSLGLKGSPDNWNPADIFMFRRSFISEISHEIKKPKSMKSYVNWLRKHCIMGNIIPLSLKQIDRNGISEWKYYNANKVNIHRHGHDFDLIRIIISPSLRSMFIETKSGYQLKINSRSSSSNKVLNYYYEGTFLQQRSSLGSIPKNIWIQKTNGEIENGNDVLVTENRIDMAKTTFQKYEDLIFMTDKEHFSVPSIMSKNDLQRYIILASHLQYIMHHQKEIIPWSFYAAQKIIKDNPVYIKIGPK